MPGSELIGLKEKKIVQSIFDNGGILSARGHDKIRKNYHVREFEQLCCKKFISKYALAVSSGTAAIKIGLKALGVNKGDEVITQAFNFVATVEAIYDIGAIPKIANVDQTLNMDVTDCEKLITSKTKVILPVHMLGVPADMTKIISLAKKYRIRVLEDNCESVGSKHNKNYAGTIGDVSALSFDFGKIITTGEGGMLLTNDKKIDKYIKEYHDHGHENNTNLPRGLDTVTIPGFNYRMFEIQGAIGKIQLSKLDYIIRENKKKYMVLDKLLSKYFEKRKILKNNEIIYDAFIFYVRDKKIKKSIVELLNKEKFGTKNLPDAINWHCSYFWKHIIEANQVKRSKKTYDILSYSIAIPIYVKRKSLNDYKELAGKIISIIK